MQNNLALIVSALLAVQFGVFFYRFLVFLICQVHELHDFSSYAMYSTVLDTDGAPLLTSL